MSPYRVQYNEYEYDINIYSFLYKNTKHAKILSKTWKMFEKHENVENLIYFLFCIMYKVHNSYFIIL